MSTKLKNIADLLRDDIVTVDCTLCKDGTNTYTFKCLKTLAETLDTGCTVLVKLSYGAVCTANVIKIDDYADIDVDAKYTYSWIFQKVELDDLLALEAEDKEAVDQLKVKQRESVRNQALASLGITNGNSLLFGSTSGDAETGNGETTND